MIKDQSIYLNNLKESTLSRLDHLIYDNQFLKSNIENKVINSTDEITAQWLSFIQVDPLYSALSYVDLEGNEIIRVNQSSTGSYNVSDDHLSNISNYYYFKEAYDLTKQEIYLSKFDIILANTDLNNATTPIIHFISPLFLNDKKVGFIIMEYYADFSTSLLASQQGLSDIDDISLMNDKGFYLASSNPHKSLFGLYTGINNMDNLSSKNEEAWTAITSLNSTSYLDQDSLYVYTDLLASNIVIGDITVLHSEDWYYVAQTSRVNHSLVTWDNGWEFFIHYLINHTNLFITTFLLNFFLAIFASLFTYSRYERYVENSHDSLTGAYNRLFGIRLARKMYQRTLKEKTNFGLMFLDVNNLKEVNDELGHRFGDDMLRILGENILVSTRSYLESKKGLRKQDLFVRYGGDEFLLFFEDIQHIQMELIWERISAENEKYVINNRKLSASHGILLVSKDNLMSLESLIEKADQLMYLDKMKHKHK